MDIKDIILLESFQRKFTKRLHGMCNIPYSQRLKQLNLERLDVRRLRVDLCQRIKQFLVLSLTQILRSFLLFVETSTTHEAINLDCQQRELIETPDIIFIVSELCVFGIVCLPILTFHRCLDSKSRSIVLIFRISALFATELKLFYSMHVREFVLSYRFACSCLFTMLL